MKRLWATLVCDFRLQIRNGFYAVTAFVLAFWIILALQIPHDGLSWEMGGMVAGNLLINTFYFMAGMVLLEKGEGTLEAQIVTPLRKEEYLLSKLISLSVLALAENVILVLVWGGFNINVLPLMVGILLASAVYILAGFVVVVRYDSVNEFLMPSVLYASLLMLPLLDYFGLVSSGLFYLHPLQAVLVLLRAGFQPAAAGLQAIAPWQIVYGLAYSMVGAGLLFYFSRRAFHRFITQM